MCVFILPCVSRYVVYCIFTFLCLFVSVSLSLQWYHYQWPSFAKWWTESTVCCPRATESSSVQFLRKTAKQLKNSMNIRFATLKLFGNHGLNYRVCPSTRLTTPLVWNVKPDNLRNHRRLDLLLLVRNRGLIAYCLRPDFRVTGYSRCQDSNMGKMYVYTYVKDAIPLKHSQVTFCFPLEYCPVAYVHRDV